MLLRDDSYHNRWCNSEALRRCGITKDTPNPAKGEIGRDPESGALTGMMIEAAAGIVERALGESGHYTPEMDQAAIARSIDTLNSYGVTAFLEAASMKPIMAALKGLDDRGVLTAWAGCSMPAVEPAFMFGAAGDELFGLREQFRGRHVKPDFVKFFLDGVPGFKTAAFHEPYTPDPIRGCCFRGATMMTVPDLIRWLGKCEKLGLSVKIHCAGDAAVTQALDAVEVVRGFNGPTKLIASDRACELHHARRREAVRRARRRRRPFSDHLVSRPSSSKATRSPWARSAPSASGRTATSWRQAR